MSLLSFKHWVLNESDVSDTIDDLGSRVDKLEILFEYRTPFLDFITDACSFIGYPIDDLVIYDYFNESTNKGNPVPKEHFQYLFNEIIENGEEIKQDEWYHDHYQCDADMRVIRAYNHYYLLYLYDGDDANSIGIIQSPAHGLDGVLDDDDLDILRDII